MLSLSKHGAGFFSSLLGRRPAHSAPARIILREKRTVPARNAEGSAHRAVPPQRSKRAPKCAVCSRNCTLRACLDTARPTRQTPMKAGVAWEFCPRAQVLWGNGRIMCCMVG